jgi:hypothetical protein
MPHGPRIRTVHVLLELTARLRKMPTLSVRRLVALTGLSEYYLWQVRKGENATTRPILGADSVGLEKRRLT